MPLRSIAKARMFDEVAIRSSTPQTEEKPFESRVIEAITLQFSSCSLFGDFLKELYSLKRIGFSAVFAQS